MQKTDQMRNLLWLSRQQGSKFTGNQQLYCILFPRHKNRKFSCLHKAEMHTFPCFSMIQAVWLMESSAAVVERGDVTGHIMQPLRLQYINGHAESPRWSPSLPAWSNFAQKSVKDHLVHHLLKRTFTGKTINGICCNRKTAKQQTQEKDPPILHCGLHSTAQ